jgi:hypothetical protein
MSKEKINSRRRPELLWKRKNELETKLRLLDQVPVSVEESSPLSTPMLGHTKGNTKSNRKKIKSQQVALLCQAIKGLEEQLSQVQTEQTFEKSSGITGSAESSESSWSEY